MGFVLRKEVRVAPDGQPAGTDLKAIPAGTAVEDIPDSELAQLAAGHFTDADTPGAEWATDDDISHPHVGRLAREAADAQEITSDDVADVSTVLGGDS